MANTTLFSTRGANALASTNMRNQAGGSAYALPSRQALAQLAVTGCMNATFYADAETQLDEILSRCCEVDSAFVAKTALYARRHGRMKDTPALLCAYLAAFDGPLLEKVFGRVIDSGKMLRNFVQIVRSGRVARQSLGSLPKRLVQRWLIEASDAELIRALVGRKPSLADVIKMMHPKPRDAAREALFGYALGREVDRSKLPEALQSLERFKADPRATMPDVPFQLLTALPLTREHWITIALNASWNTLRMSLNTFARHGVFEDRARLRQIAGRLADAKAIRKSGVFPYQLLAASRATSGLPGAIGEALATALEHATRNVPRIAGSVAIAVDVSGSMQSPVTGHRRGATTAVRCIDVAALYAATMLSANRGATVLPFNDGVRTFDWSTRSVLATTKALTALLGGGTNVSAPLAELVRRRTAPDLVVILSDNQSWIDTRRGGASETLVQWDAIRRHNPRAKLVCVDLQPYANTQAPSGHDVMNVGGFSDQVFDAIAAFANREDGADLVGRIDAMVI